MECVGKKLRKNLYIFGNKFNVCDYKKIQLLLYTSS